MVETLLDIEREYGPGGPVGNTSLASSEESALLQLAMAGYGASLSVADRAAWSLAQAVNSRAWARQRPAAQLGGEEGGESPAAAVEALLHGPLADAA